MSVNDGTSIVHDAVASANFAMKTVFILPCIVFWLSPHVTSVDPLATQFREFLNDRLNEVYERGLSFSYNVTNYRSNLIQSSDGWMSLRDGQLQNLTSWYRSHDSTVTCSSKYGVVRAIISFEPLSFSYSYYVDNGTSLSSPSDLTGTLTGLSAQLEVRVETKNTSSSKATFHLLPTQNVTFVIPPQDKTFEEEVTKVILQAQKEEVIPHLQHRIENIIDDTLSRGSTGINSVWCSSTAVTLRNEPASTTITPRATHSAETTQASTATSVTNISSTVNVMESTNDSRHRPSKSDESSAAIFDNQDQENYNMGANSVTSQNTELNQFIDELLRKAGESFSTHKLQPYTMPNSDEELYQAAIGSVSLTGNVSVNIDMVQRTDPEVLRSSSSVAVTAEVELAELSFTLTYETYQRSSGNIHGKMNGLIVQMIIKVNVSNPSAATAKLERFELLPTVQITTSFVSYNVTQEQQLAIYDAVKGVFKKKLIPSFKSFAEPVLEKSLEGKTLNVSEALSYTTPAPTTTGLTTSTATDASTTSTAVSSTPPATAMASQSTVPLNIPSTTRAVVTSTPPATTMTSQSTISTAGSTSHSTSTSHVSSTAAPTATLTVSAPALPSSGPSTSVGSTAAGVENTSQPGSSSSLRLHPRWVVTALVLFLLAVNKNIIL